MNTIANKVIDIVNKHVEAENYHPNRKVIVYVCGGDENVVEAILAHEKYIKSKTKAQKVIPSKDRTGETHFIKDLEFRLCIEKGDLE